MNTKPKPKKLAHPDQQCFYCSGVGHWKRNYPKFLEDKKHGRVTSGGTSTSINNVIDIHLATSTIWVFDTGCGSHLCNMLQGLRDVRRLAKGEMDLRVLNGARVAAVSVGTYS